VQLPQGQPAEILTEQQQAQVEQDLAHKLQQLQHLKQGTELLKNGDLVYQAVQQMQLLEWQPSLTVEQQLRIQPMVVEVQQLAQRLQMLQQQQQQLQAYLGRLTTYRTTELQPQIDKAMRERTLSVEARTTLQQLRADLVSDTWWHRQDGAVLVGLLASHANAISMLMVDLLGFDLANPSATTAGVVLPMLDEMLIKGTFSSEEAAKIIREAALTEKILSGDKLAKVTYQLVNYAKKIAASTELPDDQKKLRREVATKLRRIDRALEKYEVRIQKANHLVKTRAALIRSIDAYVQLNSPAPPAVPSLPQPH
jgi:hypothetical protein